MTRYLEHALAGAAASADDWNEHLIAFHCAFPNITPELIGRFRTADDETSYQRLARHVRDRSPDARRIVDVGCGSGELLHHLDAAFGSSIELTGVDLVESELELACQRVPRATLICGDVAELFPLQGVDVAVAHLSFLSMARVREVLRRIHNALQPGGLLTFIIEDPTASQSFIAMMAPLTRALHERYPGINLGVPERDGIEDEVTLRAVLKTTGFGSSIEIEPIVLSAHLTLDEIVEFGLRSYDFALLDKNAQAELRQRFRASFKNENERTVVKLPLKLVTARRADGISNIDP